MRISIERKIAMKSIGMLGQTVNASDAVSTNAGMTDFLRHNRWPRGAVRFPAEKGPGNSLRVTQVSRVLQFHGQI